MEIYSTLLEPRCFSTWGSTAFNKHLSEMLYFRNTVKTLISRSNMLTLLIPSYAYLKVWSPFQTINTWKLLPLFFLRNFKGIADVSFQIQNHSQLNLFECLQCIQSNTDFCFGSIIQWELLLYQMPSSQSQRNRLKAQLLKVHKSHSFSSKLHKCVADLLVD